MARPVAIVSGEEMLAQREAGMSAKEIAQKYKIREQTVYNRIGKAKQRRSRRSKTPVYTEVSLEDTLVMPTKEKYDRKVMLIVTNIANLATVLRELSHADR